MDQHLMMVLQTAASVLSGVIVLAALTLLWWKSKSSWLLIAIVAAGVSLLFLLAFAVVPGVLGATPMVLLVWPAMGLLMAAGLLGYALDESNPRN